VHYLLVWIATAKFPVKGFTVAMSIDQIAPVLLDTLYRSNLKEVLHDNFALTITGSLFRHSGLERTHRALVTVDDPR